MSHLIHTVVAMKPIEPCATNELADAPVEALARLTDDDVEGAVIALRRHLDQTNAMLHRAIAEFDRRGIARRRYVLTTKQWLREYVGLGSAEAATSCTTAQALEMMPEVAERADEGAIPAANLKQLAAIRRRHPDDFALHEAVFADIATYLTPRDLRRAIDHWRQQVIGGDQGDIAERRARRRLSINQTLDGMWRVDADLDPESGHIVATAIRAHADPGNIDPTDRRTHGQRMADAVTDVCRFALDHDATIETSGGEKPHVTVTLDYRQLTGETDEPPQIDGTYVSPETLRRIACDAGVVRIITDGPSQPLDVGSRVRTVTPAIRRALDLRDGGCTWPGCDVPPEWCDAHHVVHWADGGPTSLANLVLLCRRHHGATHDGRIPAPDPRTRPRPDE